MIHYVYLLENRDRTAMKIGTSTRPRARASNLGCRLLYTIEGDLDTEKALHKKFHKVRLMGEWFKHSHTIASYFIQRGGKAMEGNGKVGRPPKMTPCPYCARPMKSREFQTHVMRCPKRKAA